MKRCRGALFVGIGCLAALAAACQDEPVAPKPNDVVCTFEGCPSLPPPCTATAVDFFVSTPDGGSSCGQRAVFVPVTGYFIADVTPH